MGVMSCSRPECDSIMCDTYVNGIGYVCRECQNEFKEYVQEESIPCDTEGQIKEALRIFMETRKGQHAQGKEMSVDEFFNQYTDEQD